MTGETPSLEDLSNRIDKLTKIVMTVCKPLVQKNQEEEEKSSNPIVLDLAEFDKNINDSIQSRFQDELKKVEAEELKIVRNSGDNLLSHLLIRIEGGVLLILLCLSAFIGYQQFQLSQQVNNLVKQSQQTNSLVKQPAPANPADPGAKVTP